MYFFSCAGVSGVNALNCEDTLFSVEIVVDGEETESRSVEMRLIFSLKYVATSSASTLLLDAAG